MNKNQKGIAHLFLLVIVILVAIGAIGYSAYQSAQLKKQTPSAATPDTTVGWRIYRNEEYAWSLKYPPGWNVYDKGFRYLDRNGQEGWTNPKESVFFRLEPFPTYIPEGTEFKVDGLVVQFDPTKLKLEDKIAELKKLSTDLVMSSNTQVEGRPAVKTIHDSTLAKLPQDSLRRNLSTTYWVDYPEGNFLVLTINHPNTDGEGGHDEVYDQILSTFKFTE